MGRHALRRGAVDPDEQEIQVEPGKGRVGEWANQLVGLGPGDPAGDHQADGGCDDKLRRDVHRVRHHRELAAAQPAGDLRGGGPSREAYGPRLTDAERGGVRDTTLLGGMLPTAVAHRKLIERAVPDRTAVRARQQLLLLE